MANLTVYTGESMRFCTAKIMDKHTSSICILSKRKPVDHLTDIYRLLSEAGCVARDIMSHSLYGVPCVTSTSPPAFAWRDNAGAIHSMAGDASAALPIIVTISSLMSCANVPKSIYIESPEAYLFPQAQADMAKLLAYAVNAGFDVTIVSGSLVLVYALNNLVAAYTEFGYKDVHGAPEPRFRLRCTDLRSYRVDDSNCITDIMCDNGQIDESVFGAVLGDLQVEYNRIIAQFMRGVTPA